MSGFAVWAVIIKMEGTQGPPTDPPGEEEGRVEEQVQGDGGEAEDGGVHVPQQQLVQHKVEPPLEHHHQHQARPTAHRRAHHLGEPKMVGAGVLELLARFACDFYYRIAHSSSNILTYLGLGGAPGPATPAWCHGKIRSELHV